MIQPKFYRICLVTGWAMLAAGLVHQVSAQAPAAIPSEPSPPATPIPEVNANQEIPVVPARPRAKASPGFPDLPKGKALGGGYGGGFGGGYGVIGAGDGEAGGIGGGGAMGGVMPARSGTKHDSVPPVVLAFGNADAAALPRLEEDLSVMTHILSQALQRGLGDEAPQSKLGVPLLYTGSGRSVRAMYLGGFGTLFMIKVNMPLMSAPAPAEEKAAVSPNASEWESARREVLGLDAKENNPWTYMTGSEVPFDPDQVEALKRTVIGALKNASNIRDMNADENVNVAIFGQAMAATAEGRSGVSSVTFSPDGRLLTGQGGTVTFSPDARLVTTGQDGKVRVWNVNTGAQVSENSLVLNGPAAPAGAPSAEAGSSVQVEFSNRATTDAVAENNAQAPEQNEPPVAPAPKAKKNRGNAGRTAPNKPSLDLTLQPPARSAKVVSASSSGTVLTMRVKKSDIDAFAKGKLTLDDFAKKVTMATYAGNGNGILSVNSWIQSGRASTGGKQAF